MRHENVTPDSPPPVIAAFVRQICHREFGDGIDYPYFHVSAGSKERARVDAHLVDAFREEYRYHLRRGWGPPTAEQIALILCHG